jgi:hypothetical protein
MRIIIEETKEIESLSIIDPKQGTDWIGDMLGNADALGEYDEENNAYSMSQDDYEWWAEYVALYQKADDKLNEYDLDAQQEIIEILGDVEFNDYPASLISAIEEYKSK